MARSGAEDRAAVSVRLPKRGRLIQHESGEGMVVTPRRMRAAVAALLLKVPNLLP